MDIVKILKYPLILSIRDEWMSVFQVKEENYETSQTELSCEYLYRQFTQLFLILFLFLIYIWIKGLCPVYLYTVNEISRKYSNNHIISIKSEKNAWEIRIRHQHAICIENLRTNIKSIDTRNYSANLYGFYFDWKLSCEQNVHKKHFSLKNKQKWAANPLLEK